MNEKFQYRTRPPSAVLTNFEFIVSERFFFFDLSKLRHFSTAIFSETKSVTPFFFSFLE